MHFDRDKSFNLQIFHNFNQSDTSSHSMGILELLPRSNATESWNYDHSLPSSVDIQNGSKYNSIPLAKTRELSVTRKQHN